jgi:hypothetical protein
MLRWAAAEISAYQGMVTTIGRVHVRPNRIHRILAEAAPSKPNDVERIR